MIDILIILPSFFGGGAERIGMILASYLAKKNYHVTVLIFDNRDDIYLIREKESFELLTSNKKSFIRSIPFIIKFISGKKPKYIFSTFAYISLFLIFLKKILKFKLICRESNLNSLRNVSGFKNRWVMRFSGLYRYADIFLVSSNLMRNHFVRSYGVDRSKAVVWANPVDVERIRGLVDPLDNSELIGVSGRRFLAVGRLERQKNFEKLLEWFSLNSRAEDVLTILGEGADRDDLVRKTMTLGIEGQIRFKGYVANPFQIMAQSDCLLISSRWEGMPNVALEALCVGLPVIATKSAGGIIELAKLSTLVQVATDGSDFTRRLSQVKRNQNVKKNMLPDCYWLPKSCDEFIRLVFHDQS